MPFAAPNFVKTCTGSRTEPLPKLLHASLQRLDCSTRHLIQGWSQKHERMVLEIPAGWMLALGFGQGEENAQECACRTELLQMCPGTPAEQARVLSLSQENNFWNLPNDKLFLRSEQESKARAAPCLTSRPEGCPSPLSWTPLHHQCTEALLVWIQQGASCTWLKWAPHRLVGLPARYQGCTAS